MSIDDLRKRIRPELARASPYRWQEGIPDRPVDRFDMNTPAERARLVRRRRSRGSRRSRPTTTPTPPTCRSSARSPPTPASTPRQVVVGAGCDEVLALCAQLALGRGDRALVAEADLPAVHRRQPQRRRRGARARARRRARPRARGARARGRRRARSSGCAARTTRPASSSTPALVERICAACPGIVVLDQAYLELGGEDFVAADRGATRTSSSRARSRRASRSAPRASATASRSRRWPRRSTRCARRARSRRGRRPSPSSPAARPTRCASAARAIVEERGGSPRACAPRASRCSRRPATSCSRARRCPTSSSSSPSARCVVRTFAHEPLLADCFRVTVSHRDANARLLRALAELAGGEAPEAEDGVRGERVGEVRRATRETQHRGAHRPARRRPRARRDRPRVPRPHAHEPRVLVAHRHRAALPRRSLGRRAPHRRGLRASRSARRSTSRSATARACAASASARAPLDEALAEATVDLSGRGIAAARPRARRAGDRPAAVDPRSRTSSTASRAAAGSACTSTRARRRRPPRGRGRLQGAGAGAARGGRARPGAQRHREHEGRAVIATFVDYGAGNLRSLRAAFERAGAEVAVSDEPERGRRRRASSSSRASARPRPRWRRCASAASSTRSWARVRGGAHLFGVCVGMQLLFARSEEGDTAGLGLLPGLGDAPRGRAPPAAHGLERRRAGRGAPARRRRFRRPATSRTPTPCRTPAPRCVLASTPVEHGGFASLVGDGRVAGAQFHPERSGAAGARASCARVVTWAGDAA